MIKQLFAVFLFLLASDLNAQFFLGISTGNYTDNLSIGGAGFGYRMGKFSPNFSFTLNAYFDRAKIDGQSKDYDEIEFVPQIGFDYSLFSQTVEIFIPFQIGTYFWQLPSTLNYSFFTEGGIGVQKRFDEIEFGGTIGLYYRIVNYDQNENYRFSDHHITQFVKLHMKYYFGKQSI